MKKHNLFKVLMLTILLVILASWILPITSIVDKDFVTDDATKIGLFNLLTYLMYAIQVFAPTILYVLAVGGLYGVLHKIPQYRVLLEKITLGFKGHEEIFMIIVGVVFATLSSMAGLSLPLIVLFPFVIAVILMMGYNRVTAAMLTVGSTIAGLIGTVFAAKDLGPLTEVLGYFAEQNGVGNSPIFANQSVGWKILLLVISLIIVLVNVIIYAKKHKVEEIEDSEKLVPEKEETKNKKVYPIVVVFDLMLIVLALGFFSWNLFQITLFDDIVARFTDPTGSSFVKGLFKAFNSLLGLSNNNYSYAFGTWTLLQGTIVVVVASWLIAFIYRKKFNDYLSNFAKGAKKALRPAFLVLLACTIVIISVEIPMQASILKNIVVTDGKNGVFVLMAVAVLYSIFSSDLYYATYAAQNLTYFGLATATNLVTIAIAWQSMYGITMLVAPTSVILLATLSHLGITYGTWWKAIWKMFLELLLASIIILLIIAGV